MTQADQNFYDILGLPRGADAESVRKAYRRMMQQGGVHPDRGGDAATAARVNKAYATLSDPDQKLEYDLRLDVLAKVSEGLTMTQARRALNPDRECMFCGQPHDYSGCDMADLNCDACGSALQPVNSESLSPDGLRATQRIYKSVDVTFYTGPRQRRPHVAKSEDVSPQGLRIITKSKLELGQRIRIDSDILEAVGEVTNVQYTEGLFQTETAAGIAFLTLRYKQPSGTFVSRRI